MTEKQWETKNTATGHPDHERLYAEERIRQEHDDLQRTVKSTP